MRTILYVVMSLLVALVALPRDAGAACVNGYPDGGGFICTRSFGTVTCHLHQGTGYAAQAFAVHYSSGSTNEYQAFGTADNGTNFCYHWSTSLVNTIDIEGTAAADGFYLNSASWHLEGAVNLVVNGADGTDTFQGSTTTSCSGLTTTVHGDGQNDTLTGGMCGETLYGDGGNDVIDGYEGDDVVYGGDGADDITGGPGDDELYGEVGADEIEGNEGTDYLDGGPDGDALCDRDGDGAGTLFGGDQNDILWGDGTLGVCPNPNCVLHGVCDSTCNGQVLDAMDCGADTDQSHGLGTNCESLTNVKPAFCIN